MAKNQINLRVPGDILAKLNLTANSTNAEVVAVLERRLNAVVDIPVFSAVVASAVRLEQLASRLLWLRFFLAGDSADPSDADLMVVAKTAQNEALGLIADMDTCAQTIIGQLASILAAPETDLYALRCEVQAMAPRALFKLDESERLELAPLAGLLLLIMGACAIGSQEQVSRVIDLAIAQQHLQPDHLPGLPKTPAWSGNKSLRTAARFHLALPKKSADIFRRLENNLPFTANRLTLELLDRSPDEAHDFVGFASLAFAAKLSVAARLSLRGFVAHAKCCKYTPVPPSVLLDRYIAAAEKCLPKINALSDLMASMGWAYSPRHRAALEPLLGNLSERLNQKPPLSSSEQTLVGFLRLVRILPTVK